MPTSTKQNRASPQLIFSRFSGNSWHICKQITQMKQKQESKYQCKKQMFVKQELLCMLLDQN